MVAVFLLWDLSEPLITLIFMIRMIIFIACHIEFDAVSLSTVPSLRAVSAWQSPVFKRRYRNKCDMTVGN